VPQERDRNLGHLAPLSPPRIEDRGSRIEDRGSRIED